MLALIVKEFQTWLQGRAIFTLVLAVAVGLGLITSLLGLLLLARYPGPLPSLFGAFVPPGGGAIESGESTATLPAELVAHRATLLFGVGSASVLLGMLVVAPALAAGAFGVERSGGTLPLLLLHGGHGGRIAAAKILAAAGFTGLLCLVGLPSITPAWMLGHVGEVVILGNLAVLLAALVLACAVGVALSALIVETLAAAFLAQGLMLCLALALPAVTLAAAHLAPSILEPARYLLWLSPLIVLWAASGEATAALLGIAPEPLRTALTLPQPFAETSASAVPPWLWPVAVWLILTTVCWLVAAVAVDPCHPARSALRRGWRHDRPRAPPTGSADPTGAPP